MEKILRSIYNASGTDLAMTLASLIALIISFRLRNKHTHLRYFFIYPLASFVDNFSFFITLGISKTPPGEHLHVFISNSAFTLIEFFSISEMLKSIDVSRKYRKYFNFLNLIYTPFFATHFINGWKITTIHHFYLIQNLFIIACCIRYFIRIFNSTLEYSLARDPIFIITLGSATFAICTLPIFIASDFVFTPDGFLLAGVIYYINNLFYILFFSTITLAYLCPNRKRS